MIITDKNQLKSYYTNRRLWQGIPSIEITNKGRVYIIFYSGGITEQLGNYVIIVKSDDGKNFSEPIAVIAPDDQFHRCYDPCLWMDPQNRLWAFWSYAPNNSVKAAICENPDSDDLTWKECLDIKADVMLNKPTVISNGDWLLPIANWREGVRVLPEKYDSVNKPKYSLVYKSSDNGKSFEMLGYADIPKRTFDEHMIVELDNGILMMYARTNCGIMQAYSYNGGKTWTKGVECDFRTPDSRFFICRLKSGRYLLIVNDHPTVRKKLTAFLSDDGCKTWKYKLLLDERENVSYPDAKESEDGYIYITYDRERGASDTSIDSLKRKAREILYCKITEEDILNGHIVDSKSELKICVSKLGEYYAESENPYNEYKRQSVKDMVERLYSEEKVDNIIARIFEIYSEECMNMSLDLSLEIDKAVEEFNTCYDKKILETLIGIIRSFSGDIKTKSLVDEVVTAIKSVGAANASLSVISEKTGMSVHYIDKEFMRLTCVNVSEYICWLCKNDKIE